MERYPDPGAQTYLDCTGIRWTAQIQVKLLFQQHAFFSTIRLKIVNSQLILPVLSSSLGIPIFQCDPDFLKISSRN